MRVHTSCLPPAGSHIVCTPPDSGPYVAPGTRVAHYVSIVGAHAAAPYQVAPHQVAVHEPVQGEPHYTTMAPVTSTQAGVQPHQAAPAAPGAVGQGAVAASQESQETQQQSEWQEYRWTARNITSNGKSGSGGGDRPVKLTWKNTAIL